MNNKIKLRLKAGNGRYFNITHTTYISQTTKPVVSYACSTWAIIAGDRNRLNVFERKVPRKIYRSVYNHDTQVWERR